MCLTMDLVAWPIFLRAKHPDQSFDWVITNPPFRLGEEFINRSMKIARHGVAMLTRTVFIESVGRYERLFKTNPPSRFCTIHRTRSDGERSRGQKGIHRDRICLACLGKGSAWYDPKWFGFRLVERRWNAKATISKPHVCRPRAFREVIPMRRSDRGRSFFGGS